MHSHDWPGWQDMSHDDIKSERSIAPAVLAATGLPLVGMTLGSDGAWSARRWERTAARLYERVWCDRVRIVGDYLALTFHPILAPVPATGDELDRTVSAWGPAVQADLSRLTIGVVGTGSVGSIIGEALARMGFGEIFLIDFDSIENVNRDRILHAKASNVGLAKVTALARAYCDSATAEHLSVHEVEYSVTESEGYHAALNCDLLFSCVDRPWARSVLNAIAFLHLIPVIDGGIRAEPMPGLKGLRRADSRAHVATVGRACLECLGQYDSGLVAMERDGFLDDPSYIAGLPDEHQIRQKQNVFAFSLSTAGFQIAQLISLVARPLGISDPGATVYHLVTNALESECSNCKPSCLFPGLTAKGSRLDRIFIGPHPGAEQERHKRQSEIELKKSNAFAVRLLRAVARGWKLVRSPRSPLPVSVVAAINRIVGGESDES
ncbi:MAG: ThiF family adenylyltransferase [Gemmatimonadaceae bacterium]